VVETLARAVAERARRKDALYRTVGIKVVTPPFDVSTRARSLPGPVDDPALVRSVALELLSEFEGDRVRKVGVRVSNLSFEERDQASLASWEAEEAAVPSVDAVEPIGRDEGAGDAARSAERDLPPGQATLRDF
jgi:DNA polymerase IV (DinB-like DNA polymerase)